MVPTGDGSAIRASTISKPPQFVVVGWFDYPKTVVARDQRGPQARPCFLFPLPHQFSHHVLESRKYRDQYSDHWFGYLLDTKPSPGAPPAKLSASEVFLQAPSANEKVSKSVLGVLSTKRKVSKLVVRVLPRYFSLLSRRKQRLPHAEALRQTRALGATRDVASSQGASSTSIFIPDVLGTAVAIHAPF